MGNKNNGILIPAICKPADRVIGFTLYESEAEQKVI